jgi:hypothetical protein
VAFATAWLPYWRAVLTRSSRSVWVLGFTVAPAANPLPYWPAMLSRSSRIIWALGFTAVPAAGVGGAASGPMLVAAK